MPPADLQQGKIGFEPDLPGATVIPAQAVQPGHRDQRIPVNAEETFPEFVLQILQRLIKESLTPGVVRRDVLLVSLKTEDVVHGNHLQAPRALDAKVGAGGGARNPEQLGAPHPGGMLQGLLKALPADRLQQVTHRLGLEGLDGVLVIGGREHDGGPAFPAGQLARDLQAVHARHADVEEDHVRLQRVAELQGLLPVARFPDHTEALEVAHQLAQAAAGRGLVIDDQDAGRLDTHA